MAAGKENKMNAYQQLLMDSATLRMVEQIIKEHDSASIADEAKEYKRAINEIKDAIKHRYEK